MVSYRLDEARGWAIDVDGLARAITDRTRAIILISPHNPTGAVASREELDAIAAVAADHELPIIADEVFGAFLFGLQRLPRPAGTRAPLVVTLNGFSKLLALPGMKLGWMALSGETTAITRTLAALERISDAFLPVNEIVQAAVPRILSDGRAFAGRYREEIAARRDESLGIITRSARASVIPPRGGFYAAVRVNTALDDEALALHILRTSGCMVHPGFFYDLDPTHIVLSVVSTPEAGRQALGRVVAAIDSAP
jgi:aspartate/methionine/tyrosine aminotransferase